MNLLNPESDLIGKTALFYQEIRGVEVKKPIALYRLLKDTINNKACYELACPTYEDIILKKGISRRQIDDMLNKYTDYVVD